MAGSFSGKEADELKKECRIMCGLDHPNVQTLIGVCFNAETPYLIMPFMERGSLLMYLRNERSHFLTHEDAHDDQV